MTTSRTVPPLSGAELRAAARILEHRVDLANSAGTDQVIISTSLALSLARWCREDAIARKGAK